MKKIFSVIVLLTLLLTGAIGAWAVEYEVATDQKASVVLPQDMLAGPHYKIRDAVQCYGYMHSFTVDSDFGPFEVTGDYALRKLLREIQAIAKLQEVKKSKAYLDSVKGAAKMPFEFGKNIITDPVDTVSGVPKGVYRLFSNIGTSMGSERDPSEDARYKELLLLSSYKRDYAYELGVDVYSSNPVLQKELNSVGWAGAAGNLSVSAALAPFGGTGVMVVKMTSLGQSFNNMLKKEPASRLRQVNAEKLEKMGVSKELADKFLDHPAFTPTHDTVLVGSLATLTSARGQATFINLALTAEDEESANFFQNMAETMRGYNDSVSPIKDITVAFGVIFAKAENGSVMIPFPLDRGVWTERAAWVIPNALNSYKKATGAKSLGKVELWVTGTVTPLAKLESAKLGLDIVENVDQKIEFMY